MADIPESIKEFAERKGWLSAIQNVEFLASGEYNTNYRIIDKSGIYVFRINQGSQLGLSSQIEYEFKTLKLIEETGVTPRAFYYDKEFNTENPEAVIGTMNNGIVFNGVLLEEYIEGRPLDYTKDVDRAAFIFAKIHGVLRKGELIIQSDPFDEVMSESIRMLEKYPAVEYPGVYNLLLNYHDRLVKRFEDPGRIFEGESLCVVNTEVNSHNFIIGENKSCLVDWEKAVFSYRYLDLAHFLVATTTLWKINYRFSDDEKRLFLKSYHSRALPGVSLEILQERTLLTESVILLRAMSWCYMAYYEYVHLPRPIKNEATFKKIKSYLSEAEWFLK